MDIPFPSQLQWVTPLVGSHWPQGSESAWWRTAGYLRDAAAELKAQIPDLTRVRSKTQAVLIGETAQAAEQQFAQLFASNSAVDKRVEALRTLADAAENLGTEIQYTKLSIYSMLAIAAASIIFALANSEWSLGASLAQIPVIRWLTENAITRLVTMVLGRIEAELAARLGSILVARLAVEGIVSAGIGALQEGGIQAIQVAEGHRHGIDVGNVLHSGLSMGVAGMAGGLAGHEVGGLLGTEGSTAMRALKGAVTGLASGEAANVAGTLTGGGHVGAGTFLGGVIGLVHASVHGAGGHGTSVHDPTANALAPSAIDPARPASADVADTQTGAVGRPSGSTSDVVPQSITAPARRSGADAHLPSRSDGTRADRRGATDPLTTRRPDSTRDDRTRPGGARTAKLPGHSSVARDMPEDLQPTGATRAPNPLAAAKDIGVIKARHGGSDSYPGGRAGDDGNGRGGGHVPDRSGIGGGTSGGGGRGSGGGGGAGRGGAGRGGGGADDPWTQATAGPGDGGARPGGSSSYPSYPLPERPHPPDAPPEPVPPAGGKYQFKYRVDVLFHRWSGWTTDRNGREYRVLFPGDLRANLGDGPPPNEWRSVWGPIDPQGPFWIRSIWIIPRGMWSVDVRDQLTDQLMNNSGITICYEVREEYRVPDGIYSTPWGGGYLGPPPASWADWVAPGPPSSAGEPPAGRPDWEEGDWQDPEL